jgi:hypothetical protein
MRAIQVGLVFLGDETVNGPIKYSDGITDLKWLLRNLANGVFGIDTQPTQRVPAGPGGGKGRDLSDYDGEDKDTEVPPNATKQ